MAEKNTISSSNDLCMEATGTVYVQGVDIIERLQRVEACMEFIAQRMNLDLSQVDNAIAADKALRM